ncbi:MAG TPA: penicillin-binding protein 2 [Gaiellaceae bacterium]
MASTGTRARRAGSNRFLPPDPRVAEPYRFTPQLALRLGILGAVALVAFGILFFRLWALQVLSGPQYLQAALDNQVRSVRLEAQRGEILDRNGNPLVGTVPGTAVQLWPADLPKTWPRELAEVRALGQILHVPATQIFAQMRKRAGDPVTPVVVRESVERDAPINYLYEHAEQFPGVHIVPTYLRSYPQGTLAAQMLGYVSEISPQELKQLQRAGYEPGDKIGQAGLESTYDSYLRGHAGLAQLRVDSLGRPRSQLVMTRRPSPGESVRLTLDVQLQRTAQQAIQYGIGLAQQNHHWAANAGAIVAMNPNDGSILAMASYPSYNPAVYTGRVTTKRLADWGLTPSTAEAHNYPSLNRAISGLYPAGSTFKPITALAALQTHIISPSTVLQCTGSYTVYKPDGTVAQVFHNVDPGVYQAMTLPTAIGESCDTWFYQVGYDFYTAPPSMGHPLQAWASRMGIGRKTGVDVGPESGGLLPTPEWRDRTFTAKTDPHNWQVDRLWKPGDSIQLAIGQKDLLVTPLQMTRFYALLANGGKLVKPHLVDDVEEGGGSRSVARIVHRFSTPPPQSVGLDPSNLAVVNDGLYQATHASYGTSQAVFGNFQPTIVGKTGTAQKIISMPGYTGEQDQSWWCGYGPYNSTEPPQIVVCALIENGGFGAEAAAPAALKVFQQFFKEQQAKRP